MEVSYQGCVNISVNVVSYAGFEAYFAVRPFPWWRHQMESFSALLPLCAGNSPAPVNPPQKCQCRAALTFFLICVWITAWINNREAGDLRRHCAHYDVIVMLNMICYFPFTTVVCMIKDVRPQQLIMFPLLERVSGRRQLYHLTRIRVSAREAHSVNNVIVIYIIKEIILLIIRYGSSYHVIWAIYLW